MAKIEKLAAYTSALEEHLGWKRVRKNALRIFRDEEKIISVVLQTNTLHNEKIQIVIIVHVHWIKIEKIISSIYEKPYSTKITTVSRIFSDSKNSLISSNENFGSIDQIEMFKALFTDELVDAIFLIASTEYAENFFKEDIQFGAGKPQLEITLSYLKGGIEEAHKKGNILLDLICTEIKPVVSDFLQRLEARSKYLNELF